MKLTLKVLEDRFAICRLKADAPIPGWIKKAAFSSVTRTDDELSLVCEQSLVPGKVDRISNNWRVLQIAGPLDFSMIGIIADISTILGEKDISVFIISTFDTDYVMVKNASLTKAIETLKTAGHSVSVKTTSLK